MARILIVEDEPLYCESLAFILGNQGHETRFAHAVSQAVEIAERFRPEVLIVDWMLGEDCDGGQLARRLGAALPGLKTIVITGYLELAAKIAERDGIAAVLEKPFSSDEIVQAVQQVLST